VYYRMSQGSAKRATCIIHSWIAPTTAKNHHLLDRFCALNASILSISTQTIEPNTVARHAAETPRNYFVFDKPCGSNLLDFGAVAPLVESAAWRRRSPTLHIDQAASERSGDVNSEISRMLSAAAVSSASSTKAPDLASAVAADASC